MDPKDNITFAVNQIFKWIAIAMIVSASIGILIGLFISWLIK